MQLDMIIIFAVLFFFICVIGIIAYLENRMKQKDMDQRIKMKEREIIEKYLERNGKLPDKQEEIEYVRDHGNTEED